MEEGKDKRKAREARGGRETWEGSERVEKVRIRKAGWRMVKREANK